VNYLAPRHAPGRFLFHLSSPAGHGKANPYISAMTVRVLLFASYADALGRGELTLDLKEGTVVGDVVARVREMAGGRALPPSPLIALNATYAQASAQVRHGDEVAIIPPVAGG
jgi:molybdopterin synthase catalytic subunit